MKDDVILASSVSNITFPDNNVTINSYNKNYDKLLEEMVETKAYKAVENYLKKQEKERLESGGVDKSSRSDHTNLVPNIIPEEKSIMSDIFDTIKKDGEKAAYRVASKQIVTGMKAAIVKSMQSKGTDDGTLALIASMLDTEIGEALIQMILGFGLPHVPKIGEDKRVVKLSEEFRVSGMSTVGNVVISEAITHFLPAITSALSALPEENVQVRVSEEEKIQNTEAEEKKVLTVVK